MPAKDGAIDIAKTVGAALLIALALRVVLFQPYTIPSASMQPGLLTGDYIIVSKFDYGWSRASIPLNPPLPDGRFLSREPRRGDVVVFRLPRDPGQALIKRVVGLPGDRVRIEGGHVFVNGQPLPRRFLGFTADPEEPWRRVAAVEERRADGRAYVTFDRGLGHEGDDLAEVVVPEGTYFFMGDNRDNSLDSRWPREIGVGFVPAENLVGKARWALLSWRPGASILKPWTWPNLRFDRFAEPLV